MSWGGCNDKTMMVDCYIPNTRYKWRSISKTKAQPYFAEYKPLYGVESFLLWFASHDLDKENTPFHFWGWEYWNNNLNRENGYISLLRGS